MNLTEAFQKMNLIESEEFDVSNSIDAADLRNFLDEDEIDDTIDIVDVQADTEDDVEESYIGKVVMECNVCHSKFYKDPSEIIIDDETGNCNVDEECPICFSQDGYKVIGKIAPYSEDEEEKEVDVEIADVDNDGDIDVVASETEEDDEFEESFNRRLKEDKKHLKACNECDEMTECDEMDEGIGEVAGAIGGAALGAALGHPVIGAAAGAGLGAVRDTVDPLTHDLSDDEVDFAKKLVGGGLTEDFESATIETEDQVMSMSSDDNGKVTITTEPKEDEEMVGEETIAPLDFEDEREITGSDVDDGLEDDTEVSEEEVEEAPAEDEVEMDEFDEESFDDLGESYLRKVYENVDSYKTTKVSKKGNKLVVEGVIKFNSGKNKKTSFIFEALRKTNKGKVKFIGENTQITRGKKAFTITGTLGENKKYISESLNYNYRQKDSKGKSVRLYGTIKK